MFERADWIELTEANLNNRFGVTQNIDNETYGIELRFSDLTGKFVSEQFWHHSQYAKKLDNDWLITFQCGINRELIGWLFQWMSNVRVIGPPELKKLYDEQLARIMIVAKQTSDDALTYSNTFMPQKE